MGEERESLQNMHKMLLEALRHREQEVVRYLAFLVPALAGFFWLLTYEGGNAGVVFTAGALGAILLLFLGAVYSLALGYNYRYITLQLAKLESDRCLGIQEHVLVRWPRSPSDFIKRTLLFGRLPWCGPPEIIKCFWLAFLVGIVFVTAFSCWHMSKLDGVARCVRASLVALGATAFVLGALAPIWFGRKMLKTARREPQDWR